MPVNFCPTCGAELQYKEAEICPKCGVRIAIPPPASESDNRFGGFWVRLAAHIVDSVILAIIIYAILFVLIFAAALMGGGSPDTSFGFFAMVYIAWFVVAIAISVLYYAWQESSEKQATIGKQLLGLAVTDYDGNRISFGTALARYLAKIISAIVLCIGFIMIGFTEKKQGLHDYIVKTYVVKRKETNQTVVILIIAIFVFLAVTIIVAAIIAAFVFGMAGNISQTKVVAVTAQQPDANHIVITYQGGQDADELREISVTVIDSKGNYQQKSIEPSPQEYYPATGSNIEFSGAFSGKDHVTATGLFSDSSRQVILDTTI